MNDKNGWQPLGKPRRPSQPRPRRPNPLSEGFAATPFGRLARTHLFNAAGDGAVAVALAGSIFFSIDPSEARWRVALYLFLTVAPFAIVTPLIGPAIDGARGGRRGMMIASTLGRIVVCFFMVRHIDSLLLFPEAFAVLVLQKGYSVSKSALVPNLVKGPSELIEANSKLALLSAVGGMGGAMLSAIVGFLGGSAASAGLAMLIFVIATLSAFQMPSTVVAAEPAEPDERAELRSANIWLAASAMGILRGLVGFLTFLLAFEFRGGKDGVDLEPEGSAIGAATATVRGIDVIGDPAAPAWHFGVAVAAAGIGTLVGARLAPQLRRSHREENILLGALAAATVAGIIAAWSGGLFGAAFIALAVGVTASTGKLAFDSLVQRDAPDANYGRSFARFEARFQLTWVAGAAIPVVLTLSDWFGYLLIAAAAGFGTFSYFVGSRTAAASHTAAARIPPVPQPLDGRDPTIVLPEPDPTAVVAVESSQPPPPVETQVDEPPPVEAAPTPPPQPTGGFSPIISTVDGVEIEHDLGVLPSLSPEPTEDDTPEAAESEAPIEPDGEAERDDGQLGFWKA